MPTEKMWAEFHQLSQGHSAAVMLWEHEPSEEIAARLNSVGVRVAVFDPCGNRPKTSDYLLVMNANAERLIAVAASN